MSRLVKRKPEGEGRELADCLAHRCLRPDHVEVPVINDAGPDGSECALCVAEELVKAYEKAFEKSVFWPVVETARNRMNLLSFGAGDKFQEEARAIINAARMLSEHDANLEDEKQ